MRQERFSEPHKQGLERLTGDNTGLVYCNERTEYVYDVYEVADCRDPHKVKNDIVTAEHPFGDEVKILRKTIRKMLTDAKYNSEDFAEFKAYNEFVESV